MAFVARLPPLQPKVSAKLTLLAAGNGSLFAGPAVNGGLLQWGRPEGNLRRPLDVEGNGPQGQAVRVGMDAGKAGRSFLVLAALLAVLVQLLAAGCSCSAALVAQPAVDASSANRPSHCSSHLLRVATASTG